ncbi:MAG TPA: DUF1559 domain-containing protein [Planctomycetaceae bacterium]|nr:DUF1559 domain-containing protein [Planctomycetaceae bacterium]
MAATPADDETADSSPTEKPQLRGLWAVMQPAETVTEPVPESANETSIPARGLWSVMGAGSASTVPVDAVSDDELEPMELVDETEPLTVEETHLEIAGDPPATDALGAAFEFETGTTTPRLARGSQALWLGMLALPLAATAWFGILWTALPTAACAFGALILAAAEWTARGPINTAERRRVTIGAVSGAAALVLGPFVFGPLGNAAREARSGRSTSRNLQQIGTALLSVHDQAAAFPAGGTALRDNEGKSRGGHGWMASLLPFLGQQTLFQQIDFSQPYDEAVNRPAMSKPVIMFYAAGGNRALNGGGFAVSHFAGVGGDVVNARGEKQPAGIFRTGQPLTREDVTDGLSVTFAAGELGGAYPAWGDPENFRVPQLGFNKDARGFGNAARTGATMLFADGHAKFFPNATDPELLRRLATRNAGDLTSGVD